MLRLSSADTSLDINPDVGGSVTRLIHKGADVLRPTPEGEQRVLFTGCFPLVPFCNRIRNGEFMVEGHKVKLPSNHEGSPHTLHGHGWQNRWKVVEATASRAVLSYHHMSDSWPWEYEATLIYELRPAGLRAFLSVKNLSRSTMPAGLGFHPYFNRTPDSRLKAAVDGVWISDEETLPRNWHGGPLKKDWIHTDTVAHDITIDNAYTGFNGRAEIYDGERLTHTLRASPDCHWLHVFVPLGEDYFCIEPVNHMPDPFNQPNSGLKCLKAGETSLVWMDLSFA